MQEILFSAKRIDNGQTVCGYHVKDGVTGKHFIVAEGSMLHESDKVGEEGLLNFVAFEVNEDTISVTGDGWIPVDERLPEVFGKYWATIRYDDGRISEPVVVNFQGVKQKYVVDTPNGREYETWGIDSAFHGSRVIAWREYYIPEAYRPERSGRSMEQKGGIE